MALSCSAVDFAHFDISVVLALLAAVRASTLSRRALLTVTYVRVDQAFK